MGIVGSIIRRNVKRPIKNYNVEERAMKVISKDKPTPAPTHPAMQKVMDEIMKDPSKMKSSRTDPQLLQNLSQVFITSKGDNSEIRSKILPIDREPPDELKFGYEEPKVIPPGKASLRQILEFLANHSKEPETYTAEKIVKDYNLDIVDVMNILQHTNTLLLHKPPPKKKENVKQNPLRRLQNSIDNIKR